MYTLDVFILYSLFSFQSLNFEGVQAVRTYEKA